MIRRSAFFFALFWPSVAMAHPGGLNAQGCHNDRKNGGYHCHGSGSSGGSAPAPTRLFGDTSGGGDRSYSSCAAARAAGAAPIRRGDPGYSSRLDRDGDGIACE
jgi:hypothetical protein